MAAVALCEGCGWRCAPTSHVEAQELAVAHECPTELTCPTGECDWTRELTGTEPDGFTAALLELHVTRPGHHAERTPGYTKSAGGASPTG